MDINTEIAVQPGGIRFAGIAGIGIRILFSGATKPTPRKYQQHENADLNDNANHGSPPLWNESLQPRAIRGGLNSLGDRSSCCFDLSFRCASPKESQRVTQPSSHLFARTGGNYYCKETHRPSHGRHLTKPRSSCGARARQSELDSRNLVAVS